MSSVLVARIDDRLIHGQVVTAWVKAYPITDIVIVDDELAGNALMQRIYRAAAPTGVTVEVWSLAAACDALTGQPAGSARYLVLAKTPQAFENLIEAGVPISKIVLGGMGSGPGRTTLIRNISASPDERASLKRLIDRGVSVVYQMVPSDREVDISAALRKGA